MSLTALALAAVAVLAAGYALYGRLLARLLRLDDAAPTPAHVHDDGVDFSPTPAGYLLGQHFSAIAAAGPIVGPILACQEFGWLPCLLWITLGSILIGAVHDFTALVASVRHDATTIAGLVREHLGARAGAAFMAFIWLALLYVIVAFTDVTAGTFVGRIEELDGIKVGFDAGGAVALASVTYLGLALVMGLLQRRFAPPLWLLTVVFVPLTLGAVALGEAHPGLLAFPGGQKAWGVAILAYCFVGSLLPVWLLMQPRGYLGGFILYLVVGVGVAGLLSGGFEVAQPAFKGATVLGPDGAPTPTGLLFPFLFVTIACGACSGFHGLVCSGTTSRQLDREGDCTPVGYGAMLLEGVVAIIALTTVMVVAAPKGAPGAIYGQGIGRYLASLIGQEHLLAATVFGSMAFSTFVFDTLDVATRLGRYCLQELTGARGPAAAAAATAATIGIPLLIVLTGAPGGYRAYWTLFGASNQLLAALTLLGITVWLRRTGRPAWFAAVPMVFVLAVTTTALGRIALRGLLVPRGADGALDLPGLINGVVAALLLGLAGLLVVEAVRALGRPAAPTPAGGAAGTGDTGAPAPAAT